MLMKELMAYNGREKYVGDSLRWNDANMRQSVKLREKIIHFIPLNFQVIVEK